MRWNLVKKTVQWAVFGNVPEGLSLGAWSREGSCLRIRGARSAVRNSFWPPSNAAGRMTARPVLAKARSDERAFVWSDLTSRSRERCISFGLREAIGPFALPVSKSALLDWLVSVVR